MILIKIDFQKTLEHWENLTNAYFVRFPEELNNFLKGITILGNNKPIYTTSFMYLFSIFKSYLLTDCDKARGILLHMQKKH